MWRELTDIVRTTRLLGQTVGNMRSDQIQGVFERKARHAVFPKLPVDFDAQYERRIPDRLSVTPEAIAADVRTLRESLSHNKRSANRERVRGIGNATVAFLNHSVTFDSRTEPDWSIERYDKLPALWWLKLHGFVPLKWALRGFDRPPVEVDSVFRAWVSDWLEKHAIGTDAYLRRAWTPYAVSLRLLNWCRYCAWRTESGLEPDDELRRGAYKNALFLANHVEHDVGGNHLVENGAALVTAGLLFRSTTNDWVQQGADVLDDAADQFLSDGGHFERSPMYHVLTLTRYLMVYHLLGQSGERVPDRIAETAASGSTFLRGLLPPDNRIPLCNDSALDEALSAKFCLRYAKEVGVELDETVPTAFPETGYYWLGDGPNRLLFDGGPVGPTHLPGHSHNDLLQVLLWLDGERVVTDTGVYHYEPDQYRTASRSVRGHNTVQVGSDEPIAIGSRYLMGERAAPKVEVERRGSTTIIRGGYTTQGDSDSSYTHHRTVVGTDLWWLVWDDVRTDNPRTFHNRLHLSPDVSLSTRDDGRDAIELSVDRIPDAAPSGYVYPVGVDSTSHEKNWYFPRFREKRARSVLDFTHTPRRRVGYGYVLSTDVRDIQLEQNADGMTEVSIDGRTISIKTDET